ncbi:C-reactive protein 1.4-like [Centruroides sculpturatus]|uniref:C-reactive protein 1.4-like n=1 Tax=Centruroides sculpturatus TaxID=218467 RepID=UPI000C6DDD11|nr:C-reactive protein 1.4-like [Centruroides sculpturatus]
MLVLNFIILFTFFAAIEGCLIQATLPPPSNNQFPRIRLRNSLPTLREFTFCSWIRPHTLQKSCYTVASYATSSSDNTITSIITYRRNVMKVHLYIKSVRKVFRCPDIKWKINEWYHMCSSWTGSNGTAEVLMNGVPCSSNGKTRVNISKPGTVQGGGVFIIGQEQDMLDAKFSSSQSWIGDIAGVHLWDKALSRNEVVEAGNIDNYPNPGNVISWMKTPTLDLDGVKYSKSDLCPVLGFTPIIV